MKYIAEFRDGGLAEKLAQQINAIVQPDRQYRIMEFCGGHTHAIFRYGIPDLLPENVEMVHGPGCPVCVLPTQRIDQAIFLASQAEVILCSYGDILRVPATDRNSLLKAKSAGNDIRMVYSTLDALRIARENPEKTVIFFAIGFETTTPTTAAAVLQAEKEGLKNFLIFGNHVLTPSAIRAILETRAEEKKVQIDGFLGPSHVSTVIGSDAYQEIVRQYQKPVVIAGFEPLDVLQSILMLLRQLNLNRCEIENQYTRLVTDRGNQKAQHMVSQVFTVRDTFEWRGLGFIPKSALELRPEYRHLDAETHYNLPEQQAKEIKGCDCPAILRGQKKPVDCRLFGTVCTPENPMGSCMVSAEGACAAYWQYARQRLTENRTKIA